MDSMIEEDVLRKMIKEAMSSVLKGDDMPDESQMMDDELPDEVDDFISGEEEYEDYNEEPMVEMVEEEGMDTEVPDPATLEEEAIMVLDIQPPKKKKKKSDEDYM